MKLSEILKDWPEKKEHEHLTHSTRDEDGEFGWCSDCNGTFKGSPLQIFGYNTALTSCDREIDREALAKVLMDIMYSGHQRWSYLHEDQRQQFEFEAAEIISTMPTWLRKVSEK